MLSRLIEDASHLSNTARRQAATGRNASRDSSNLFGSHENNSEHSSGAFASLVRIIFGETDNGGQADERGASSHSSDGSQVMTPATTNTSSQYTVALSTANLPTATPATRPMIAPARKLNPMAR